MSASASSLLDRFAALPVGYSEGLFEARRYGVTVQVSQDRRRWWIWAEALGGTDRVSANLYVLADDRILLKPCEMAAGKVEDFVTGYRALRPPPSGSARASDAALGPTSLA